MGEIPGRMNHSQAKSKKRFSKWHGNDYLETAGQPFSDEKLPFERRREWKKPRKISFFACDTFCVSSTSLSPML
jgi:hypothetical protein